MSDIQDESFRDSISTITDMVKELGFTRKNQKEDTTIKEK